jgi:hypothetical protein
MIELYAAVQVGGRDGGELGEKIATGLRAKEGIASQSQNQKNRA